MHLIENIRLVVRDVCELDVLSSALGHRPVTSSQTHIVRWPGLVTHAARLGVSRFHLYRVLTGERRSRRLMAAYRQITAGTTR